MASDQDPPPGVLRSLEEALDLLATLEDARDALNDSDYLVLVVELEARVRHLSRKLEFDDPEGGSDE